MNATFPCRGGSLGTAAVRTRFAVALGLAMILSMGALGCDAPGGAGPSPGAHAEHRGGGDEGGHGSGHGHGSGYGHGSGHGHGVSSQPVRVVRARRLLGPVTSWPAVSVATAAHAAAVGTTIAGRVVDVLVAEGDRVVEGAPVLRLISPERALLAAQEATSRTQLEVVRRRLADVRRQQRRGLMLADAAYALERDAAGLRAQVEQATAALRGTRDPACSAAAGATAARDHDPDPADVTLCAPLAGVVERVTVRRGALLAPADAAPILLRGLAIGRVRVERWGAPPPDLQLRFEADGRRVALATAPVSEVVDPHSGVTHAYHLPDPATALAAGLRGEVVGLLDAEAGAVFAVPRAAVAQREGELVVFRLPTARGSEPAAVAVQVLGGDPAEVWIRSAAGAPGGLSADDDILAVAPALEGGVGGH